MCIRDRDGSETNPTKIKLGIETSTNQKRRLQVYRPVWEKDFPELRPVSGNAYKAKCTLCVGKAGEGFSISHGGVTDVRHHFNSASHKQRRLTLTSVQTTLMKSFYKVDSVESDKVCKCMTILTFRIFKIIIGLFRIFLRKGAIKVLLFVSDNCF